MDSIDEETHTPAEFYSAFSNSVYKYDDDERLKRLEDQGITGWEIDHEINNQDRVMYKRKKRHQETGDDVDGYDVILSSRGTSQTRNLLPDLAIMFGGEENTTRYHELKQDYNKMNMKYGYDDRNKMVSTGHSLAGNMSTFLNRKYGIENHAFNPGASVSHLKQGLISKAACWMYPEWDRCKQAEKSHIYHVPGDPLSTAAMFGNDNKYLFDWKDGAKHPHTLNNFLKKRINIS